MKGEREKSKKWYSSDSIRFFTNENERIFLSNFHTALATATNVTVEREKKIEKSQMIVRNFSDV